MEEKLKNACLAFSCGDVDELMPFLAPDVEWRNVGKDAIHGADAVRAICYQIAQEPVTLQISSQFEGDTHLVVQGHGDAERAFCFCDIFQVDDNHVTIITSYLVAQEESKT